jgi:cystathionine beta-lyase
LFLFFTYFSPIKTHYEGCAKHGKTIEDVEHACWDVGVALQDGRQFHGPCHLRINLALPFSRVQEAFERMDKYVFNA